MEDFCSLLRDIPYASKQAEPIYKTKYSEGNLGLSQCVTSKEKGGRVTQKSPAEDEKGNSGQCFYCG